MFGGLRLLFIGVMLYSISNEAIGINRELATLEQMWGLAKQFAEVPLLEAYSQDVLSMLEKKFGFSGFVNEWGSGKGVGAGKASGLGRQRAYEKIVEKTDHMIQVRKINYSQFFGFLNFFQIFEFFLMIFTDFFGIEFAFNGNLWRGFWQAEGFDVF